MLKVIKFQKEEKYVKDFLELPKKLYDKRTLMQNRDEEEMLLMDNHPLSKYFHLDKFNIYKNEEIVARFVVTTYPNEDIAYIGFFECINDKGVAEFLFKEADKFVNERGYTKIVGPYDGSFWIKYRLKVNNFDTLPYTSEPYNKEYYLELFEDSGYKVINEYVSNIYSKLPLFNYKNEKAEKRYKMFLEKGYVFESPTKENFEEKMKEVYKLLMELYKDFPTFKNISQEDFEKQYVYFKYIMDKKFMKMVYYNSKPVGFFIGIPNYNNLLYGKLTKLDYLKIGMKRFWNKEYVLLYLGVDKNHKGLGLAMTNEIMKELHKKRAKSIGALIKDGNINRNYVSDVIDKRYKYVLLEKEIKI